MKKLISIFIVVVLSVFLNVGYASASVELPMIYGYVFDNVVRDGDLNSGEFPIGGVTITLSGPKFSTTTSSSVHGSINGTFSFIVHTPGIYYLTETNP